MGLENGVPVCACVRVCAKDKDGATGRTHACTVTLKSWGAAHEPQQN